MQQIGIIEAAVLSFVCIFAVHQLSRKLSGPSADAYPSGALIAAGLFWVLTENVPIAIAALVAAAAGHFSSVFACKRFGWHQKNDKPT
ncbi:MAG: hypothetical protein R3183_06640 [Oleiphilaceae bacterium]|nr:hypothetical protein [Oleiphilaceae bacterium]